MKCDKCNKGLLEVKGGILYKLNVASEPLRRWRCRECWCACKNEIPPMVHPLGRHWNQPPRADILIDETHAVMSEATLAKLSVYDHSQPSGVYEGKMWVWRGNLAWFGFSEKPDCVSNNYRKIRVLEKPFKVPPTFH